MKVLPPWHVLCVFAGRDVAVAERLADNGLVAYSPHGVKVVVHKRYKTRIPKPFALFPGYLFVTGENLLAALGVYGVFGFLGSEEAPSILPRGYVERMQEEEAKGTFDISKKKSPGDKVKVEIFGHTINAEVVRSSGEGIKVIAEYMGKMITVTDCIEKLELQLA